MDNIGIFSDSFSTCPFPRNITLKTEKDEVEELPRGREGVGNETNSSASSSSDLAPVTGDDEPVHTFVSPEKGTEDFELSVKKAMECIEQVNDLSEGAMKRLHTPFKNPTKTEAKSPETKSPPPWLEDEKRSKGGGPTPVPRTEAGISTHPYKRPPKPEAQLEMPELEDCITPRAAPTTNKARNPHPEHFVFPDCRDSLEKEFFMFYFQRCEEKNKKPFPADENTQQYFAQNNYDPNDEPSKPMPQPRRKQAKAEPPAASPAAPPAAPHPTSGTPASSVNSRPQQRPPVAMGTPGSSNYYGYLTGYLPSQMYGIGSYLVPGHPANPLSYHQMQPAKTFVDSTTSPINPRSLENKENTVPKEMSGLNGYSSPPTPQQPPPPVRHTPQPVAPPAAPSVSPPYVNVGRGGEVAPPVPPRGSYVSPGPVPIKTEPPAQYLSPRPPPPTPVGHPPPNQGLDMASMLKLGVMGGGGGRPPALPSHFFPDNQRFQLGLPGHNKAIPDNLMASYINPADPNSMMVGPPRQMSAPHPTPSNATTKQFSTFRGAFGKLIGGVSGKRKAGESSGNQATGKRTKFTPEQIRVLDHFYTNVNRYVVGGNKASLCQLTGLELNTILMWFQNKRARDKKKMEGLPCT